ELSMLHARIVLRAVVRLHFSMLSYEQLLRPQPRDRLYLVPVLAAAIVAPPGVALGILVGEDRPGGLHHRAAGVILRGDELQLVVLALRLTCHGTVDVGILLLEALPGGACVKCLAFGH